jgi:hypothetical protein
MAMRSTARQLSLQSARHLAAAVHRSFSAEAAARIRQRRAEFENDDGQLQRVAFPANNYDFLVEPSEYHPPLEEEHNSNSQV